MAIMRVQTTIEHVSGLPENSFVNTLHMSDDTTSGPVPTANVDAIVAAVKSFYETVQTDGNAIKSWFSSEVNQGGNIIFHTKVYDLRDPLPRVPLHAERWASTISGTMTPLPGEVCICASFQAAPTSGVAQASRRGRLFLGPLRVLAAAAGAGGAARPSTAVMNTVVNAMGALKAASDAAPAWSWGVYSQKHGTIAPVANGWVDDAFDTQRRRGVAPSTRVLF